MLIGWILHAQQPRRTRLQVMNTILLDQIEWSTTDPREVGSSLGKRNGIMRLILIYPPTSLLPAHGRIIDL